MKRSVLSLLSIALILPLLGISCAKAPSASLSARAQPITLTWWRPFDEPGDFSAIIKNYQALHPNVNIVVRTLRPEEYEKLLVNALAEDRGPDLFSIHNTWMDAYEPKILPMPPVVDVIFITQSGGISQETTIESKKIPTLNLRQLKDRFLPVVETDVVRDVADATTRQVKPTILGLPLSVDTLAMFYNKDLLAQNKIVSPPVKWDEFQTDAKAITRLDQADNIVQSGAALGSAKNISRSPDLVSLLMMQNGAVMSTANGAAAFDQTPDNFSGPVPPGIGALRFYTDFARANKEVYSWNENQVDSLDAFAAGKVGFYFGYAYHLPMLKAKAPKLNFDIAPHPQLDPEHPVTFANYWIETVSKRTKFSNEAWDFLIFATGQDQVKTFLDSTRKPTALRALVSSQLDDLELGAFAQGLINARSWYRGKDSAAMDGIFRDMITEALTNAATDEDKAFEEALKRAVSRVNQTL